MNDLNEEIIRLIKESKLTLAFIKLEENNIKRSNFILLQNRFNSATEKLHKGVINSEDYQVELNRIVASFLYELDRLSIKNKKQKTSFSKSFVVVLITFFTIGVASNTWKTYNSEENIIALQNEYDVLIIPFSENVNSPIKEVLKNRLYQFSRENSLNVNCNDGNEFLIDFDGSYIKAKEIGSKTFSELVLFGSAYNYSKDSLFLNLRYQSTIIDSFYSDGKKSLFNLRYIHEILQGKITGEVENVILKTAALIKVHNLLEDPKTALDYIENIILTKNDPFYISIKANLNILLKDFESAKSDFEYLLTLDSTNINAINNLSIIYAHYYKDLKKANSIMHKSLNCNIPNNELKGIIANNFNNISNKNPITFNPRHVDVKSEFSGNSFNIGANEIRVYDSIYFSTKPILEEKSSLLDISLFKYMEQKIICTEIDFFFENPEENPILVNEIEVFDDKGEKIKEDLIYLIDSIKISPSRNFMIKKNEKFISTIRINANTNKFKDFKIRLHHTNPLFYSYKYTAIEKDKKDTTKTNTGSVYERIYGSSNAKTISLNDLITLPPVNRLPSETYTDIFVSISE